jgi:hypothetical protein
MAHLGTVMAYRGAVIAHLGGGEVGLWWLIGSAPDSGSCQGGLSLVRGIELGMELSFGVGSQGQQQGNRKQKPSTKNNYVKS